MLERQPLGVQRLAAEAAQRGDQLRRGAFRQLQAAAVERIAHQRVADVGEVHADLVGAAGLQVALEQAVRVEALA